MKLNTNDTTATQKSSVHLHELMLFAGAAIMLAVAYPRADLAPKNTVALNIPATLASPATTDSEIMSPVELTDTALLTNIEKVGVIPAAANPLPSQTEADPAS